MKKCKGFSLIECIVALAILGIASLTMAEIYACISRMNINNHMVNTSLAYQMKMVETKTNSEAVKIPSNETTTTGTPPHMRSNVNHFCIENVETGEIYSFPVDCYVLLSRDRNDKNSDESTEIEESDIKLRYKYLVAAN